MFCRYNLICQIPPHTCTVNTSLMKHGKSKGYKLLISLVLWCLSGTWGLHQDLHLHRLFSCSLAVSYVSPTSFSSTSTDLRNAIFGLPLLHLHVVNVSLFINKIFIYFSNSLFTFHIHSFNQSFTFSLLLSYSDSETDT